MSLDAEQTAYHTTALLPWNLLVSLFESLIGLGNVYLFILLISVYVSPPSAQPGARPVPREKCAVQPVERNHSRCYSDPGLPHDDAVHRLEVRLIQEQQQSSMALSEHRIMRERLRKLERAQAGDMLRAIQAFRKLFLILHFLWNAWDRRGTRIQALGSRSQDSACLCQARRPVSRGVQGDTTAYADPDVSASVKNGPWKISQCRMALLIVYALSARLHSTRSRVSSLAQQNQELRKKLTALENEQQQQVFRSEALAYDLRQREEERNYLSQRVTTLENEHEQQVLRSVALTYDLGQREEERNDLSRRLEDAQARLATLEDQYATIVSDVSEQDWNPRDAMAKAQSIVGGARCNIISVQGAQADIERIRQRLSTRPRSPPPQTTYSPTRRSSVTSILHDASSELKRSLGDMERLYQGLVLRHAALLRENAKGYPEERTALVLALATVSSELRKGQHTIHLMREARRASTPAPVRIAPAPSLQVMSPAPGLLKRPSSSHSSYSQASASPPSLERTPSKRSMRFSLTRPGEAAHRSSPPRATASPLAGIFVPRTPKPATADRASLRLVNSPDLGSKSSPGGTRLGRALRKTFKPSGLFSP